MKIKSLKVLNDGMPAHETELLWSQVEEFASYAFNASHAVEYTVISWWTMWLKVRYPAEFFAASMTVVDKEDKLATIVTEAQTAGLKVLPPDINHSSNRVEIKDDNTLLAPFQAVKGISENTTAFIIEARESKGGVFSSIEDFESELKALGIAGKVNKRHREALRKVGALASIEPGSLAPMHPDRLKDRLELMPGFTVEMVKASRGLSLDSLAAIKIKEVVGSLRTCDKCPLAGLEHPIPRLGAKAKVMMVFDSPNFKEARDGKMMGGDSGDLIKAALSDVGLDFRDFYFTSLVKSPKPSGEKALTNEQINACSEILKQELEILKPAVVVAMGTNAIRFFVPGIKGSPAEIAGKVIFDPKLDASIVLGLSPGSVYYDPSKIKLIQDVMSKISDLIA